MSTRRFSALARAMALAFAGVCACAHAIAQTPPPAQITLEAAKSALHVSDGVVVNLNIDRTFGQPLEVTVPIEGQPRRLQLVPNSIRTSDYQLLEVGADGIPHPTKAGAENSLIGRVAEVPGAEIAGGMMPDGLYCTILMPDGSRYWVESIESRVPGAQAGDHLVYRGGDVEMGNYACGNHETHGVDTSGAPPEPRDAQLYTAILACDADFEFFSQYGSTSLTQARITLVINTMNLQYARDVAIRHILGTIVVRTSTPQPYTATDSGALVTQVRNEWNANQGGVSRNVVQMFTNRTVVDAGNPPNIITIGRAFTIGSICNDQSYCFVWSNFNNNFASATDLSAHELGHLWNACHCSCDGGTAATRFTMNPLITSINKFGPGGANSGCGSDNVTEITNYRTFRWFPPPIGAGCLGLTTGPVPVNDACNSATALAANATIAMSNVASTTDGPVSSCRTLAGNDVWYSFIAPCDGTYTVDTCDSGFDTVLTAYTGFCGGLTEVAFGCNDDTSFTPCGGTNPSRIQFAVSRGTFYLIKLAGYNNLTGTGFLTTSMSGCPAPGNDSCGSYTTIANGFPLAFSTVGATTDGPVEAACNSSSNSQVGQDIWFRFVAPCTSTVRVSTCGADFDSRIAIYSGSCPTVPNTAIACNDDNGPACSGTRSSVDFSSIAGAAYMIRVGGYSTNVGSGTLSVDSFSCPRPPNDNCASATSVSNGSVVFNDFLSATNDGSASCGSSTLSRDVWFDFVAPVDGILTVNTCGTNDSGGLDSGVDTVMSLHSGCPGNEANQLAGSCNDDNFGECGSSDSPLLRDSYLTLAMTGGQNVKIRVANFSNGTPPNKQIQLNVSYTPANDNCASAPTIAEGFSVWYNGSANTDGPNPPSGACGSLPMNNDVWYRYVASCTGSARISLCGSPFDTVLAVYSGTCAALGAPIACSDDNGVACAGSASSLDVNVVAGQAYMLRMGSYFVNSTGTGFRDISCTSASGGACCNGATCSVQAQAACTGIATRFAGAGTSCNAPGVNTTPCCKADFNQNGSLQVQDIFDFLNGWFAGAANTDMNGGGLAVQDIFDFLNAWFAGC